MHHPRPFEDDDPPPRGSARLLGDRLRHLGAYRRTAELRAGSPVRADSHHFHRNLMVLIGVRMGLRHEVVADAMKLSRSRVTHIVAEMELLMPAEDPAD